MTRAIVMVIAAVLIIDYGSRLVSLSSQQTTLESKVVGKTPAGFHRKHFQEWLDHCWQRGGPDWCRNAMRQPSLIEEFGSEIDR